MTTKRKPSQKRAPAKKRTKPQVSTHTTVSTTWQQSPPNENPPEMLPFWAGVILIVGLIMGAALIGLGFYLWI